MNGVVAMVEKAIDAVYDALPGVSLADAAKAVEAAQPFLVQAHMEARRVVAYEAQKEIVSRQCCAPKANSTE